MYTVCSVQVPRCVRMELDAVVPTLFCIIVASMLAVCYHPYLVLHSWS